MWKLSVLWYCTGKDNYIMNAENLWINGEILLNPESFAFYGKDEWNTGALEN